MTSSCSVSEISRVIQSLLQINFENIEIYGEVSNLLYHSSGHLYFKLHDKDAVMDMVCWRSRVPYLNFHLKEGMQITVKGSITSYIKRSSYQMNVTNFQMAGQGVLLAEFNELKKHFTEDGIFDNKHKKSLPYLPENIAIITSETGAVLQDIAVQLEKRYVQNVYLYSTQMQGTGSSQDIIRQINRIEKQNNIDVIVIARGGGSMEDLWSFNDAELVKRIFKCKIPIISAIGHETDYTLIDFVSDIRAPTPTAVGELLAPNKTEIESLLDNFQLNMYKSIRIKYQNTRQLIDHYKKNLDYKVKRKISYIEKFLDHYKKNIQHQIQKKFDTLENFIYSSQKDTKYRITRKFQFIQNQISYYDIKINAQLKKKNQYIDYKISSYQVQIKNRLYQKYSRLLRHISKNTYSNIHKKLAKYEFQLNQINFSKKKLISRLIFYESMLKYIESKCNLKPKYIKYETQIRYYESFFENYNYQKQLDKGYTIVRDEESNKIIYDLNDIEYNKKYNLEHKNGLSKIKFSK